MKLSIKAALAAAPFALIGCSYMPTMSSAPDVPAPIAVPAGKQDVDADGGRRRADVRVPREAGRRRHIRVDVRRAYRHPMGRESYARRSASTTRGPTWESNDGSKVTGKQLATAPATNAGAIPLQLVQAAPATGNWLDAGRHLHPAVEHGRWRRTARAMRSLERWPAPAGEVRGRLRFL